VFRASRKLGGLVVAEVDPMTIRAASSLAWVDGLVAALARQPPSRGEMQTIRS
jgi:hypothetical protein